MLSALLACFVGTANTDLEAALANAADTADTGDTGADDCPTSLDPESVAFAWLQIDGVTVYPTVDAVCLSEDGAEVRISFHVEGGASGTIVYRAEEKGGQGLPLAAGSLEVTYDGTTWEGTDWQSGYVGQYGDHGELSGQAYDADTGSNLSLSLSWGDSPIAE